ncbi:hypothetical protein SAMN05421806_116136 [Streptomyces indicus]|uniref:Uncharacterized protein n=1 Tax=Streptomyces indicus TaxID=417292 RepID=A0A1G9GQ36_9ACTN|nr:hypothetical protein SAMN05421806_116136 [Streptomyces indicus]
MIQSLTLSSPTTALPIASSLGVTVSLAGLLPAAEGSGKAAGRRSGVPRGAPTGRRRENPGALCVCSDLGNQGDEQAGHGGQHEQGTHRAPGEPSGRRSRRRMLLAARLTCMHAPTRRRDAGKRRPRARPTAMCRTIRSRPLHPPLSPGPAHPATSHGAAGAQPPPERPRGGRPRDGRSPPGAERHESGSSASRTRQRPAGERRQQRLCPDRSAADLPLRQPHRGQRRAGRPPAVNVAAPPGPDVSANRTAPAASRASPARTTHPHRHAMTFARRSGAGLRSPASAGAKEAPDGHLTAWGGA